MRLAPMSRARLDVDLDRLKADRVVELALDDLRDLVEEPELDPFTPHRSPELAGVDDLAATLASLRRLPDDLTVRVLLPAGAPAEPSPADAEAAMHRRATYLATTSWRDGMAIRSMGWSQAPLGLLIAFVAAAVAYGAAAVASSSSGTTVGLFAIIAGLAITIAWVVSWMVIESATLDWRPMGRKAQAYELLAAARLEVVREPKA
jgi:hypothetical protein